MTPHPDDHCHGCNQPIEPLAAIRVYHAGCDPQGRVEMLEKVLRGISQTYVETRPTPESLNRALYRVSETARAALDYRPAQMKAKEG